MASEFLRTVATVFAQAPDTSYRTTIKNNITTLLSTLDSAVTAGAIKKGIVRDQLHDDLLAFSERIATALSNT